MKGRYDPPDLADGGLGRIAFVIEGETPSQQLVGHHTS